MANIVGGRVIVIDTTAAFTQPLRIKSIFYEPGSDGPSVTIRENGSASGTTVFLSDATTDQFITDVGLQDNKGFHVTVAGTGTIVRLILE
jgi:hypothetical protein